MGPPRKMHDVHSGGKSHSIRLSLDWLWPILVTTSFFFHALGLWFDPGELKLPEHYVYDLIPSSFHENIVLSCGSVILNLVWFILIFGIELWTLSFGWPVVKRLSFIVIRDFFHIWNDIVVMLVYAKMKFPGLYFFVRVNYSLRDDKNRPTWDPVVMRACGIIRSQAYDILGAIMRLVLIPFEASASIARFLFAQDQFTGRDITNATYGCIYNLPFDAASLLMRCASVVSATVEGLMSASIVWFFIDTLPRVPLRTLLLITHHWYKHTFLTVVIHDTCRRVINFLSICSSICGELYDLFLQESKPYLSRIICRPINRIFDFAYFVFMKWTTFLRLGIVLTGLAVDYDYERRTFIKVWSTRLRTVFSPWSLFSNMTKLFCGTFNIIKRYSWFVFDWHRYGRLRAHFNSRAHGVQIRFVGLPRLCHWMPITARFRLARRMMASCWNPIRYAISSIFRDTLVDDVFNFSYRGTSVIVHVTGRAAYRITLSCWQTFIFTCVLALLPTISLFTLLGLMSIAVLFLHTTLNLIAANIMFYYFCKVVFFTWQFTWDSTYLETVLNIAVDYANTLFMASFIVSGLSTSFATYDHLRTKYNNSRPYTFHNYISRNVINQLVKFACFLQPIMMAEASKGKGGDGMSTPIPTPRPSGPPTAPATSIGGRFEAETGGPRLDPANVLLTITKIFGTAKAFTGDGALSRAAFATFYDLLSSTLSSWNSYQSPENYTLHDTLSQKPLYFDLVGIEFSKILFRALLHITTATALRLVLRHKANEDGCSAFNDLKTRYKNSNIGIIADLQKKIQDWHWPDSSIDPQNSMLDLNEMWSLLRDYGVDMPENTQVTFLVAKMRSSKAYRTLPTLWGGIDLEKFLKDTTTQDIFDKVYSYWDQTLRTETPPATRPGEQILSGTEHSACRICRSPTCNEHKCSKRRCLRCGREGHTIDECKANLNRQNNGNGNNRNNNGGNNNNKDKKCSKCGENHAFRLCPTNECHHCGGKGHIRPDCPKFEKNIKARKSGDAERNNTTTETSVDGGSNGLLDSTSFEPGMFSFRDHISETSLPSHDHSRDDSSSHSMDFIPPVYDADGRLVRGSWPFSEGPRPTCEHPQCDAPVYGIDSDGQFHVRFCGNSHRRAVTRAEHLYGDWHDSWGPRPTCKGPHCDELVYGIDHYTERTHADFCSRSCARQHYYAYYNPSSPDHDHDERLEQLRIEEQGQAEDALSVSISDVSLPLGRTVEIVQREHLVNLITRESESDSVAERILRSAIAEAVVKDFIIDSAAVRNLCRHRDWFDPATFTTDGPHLIMRGIVTGVGEAQKAPEFRTEGYGIVPLRFFFTQFDYVDLRVPMYYAPRAGDDIIDTDCLKEGVSARLGSLAEDCTSASFSTTRIFYSTETDSLYNSEQNIRIPLVQLNQSPKPGQGSHWILRACDDSSTDAALITIAARGDDVTIDSTLAIRDRRPRAPDTILEDEFSLLLTVFQQIQKLLFITFTAEMFSNDDESNALMPGNTYTPSNSVFDADLTGHHVYGHPIYEDEFILKTIRFCLSQFQLRPTDSTFTLILPRWTQTTWWALVERYFQIAMTISTSTPALSRPRTSDDQESITSEQDNGRVIVDSQKWPLVVVHLARTTLIKLDDTLLAHNRWCHAAENTLKHVFTSGVATGLRNVQHTCSDILCHICNKVKATRPAFRDLSQATRSELPEPLHSLFMDIHGPIGTTSINGFRYILGLICASTGFCWIEMLKLKSDSTTALRAIFTRISTNPSISINFLRARTVLYSDNAKEFATADFEQLFTDFTIQHRFTSPYNHIENYYIERLWRTLADSARALLTMSGIPLKFWTAAWRHAAHVYNILPRAHRDEKGVFLSPHERLTGQSASLAHLRLFGCDAYAYIEPGARTGGKLAAERARHGRYVGHNELNTRTVILLDMNTEQVFLSGMVKFSEDLDKTGKIISNPQIELVSFEFQELDDSRTTRPSPFSASRKDFKKITSVLGHIVFFDEDDKETYALVELTNGSNSFWTYALNFLYYSQPVTRNRDMMIAYLRNMYSTSSGYGNTFFPLFSTVHVKVDSINVAEGILISTDAHSIRKYGVVYFLLFIEKFTRYFIASAALRAIGTPVI